MDTPGSSGSSFNPLVHIESLFEEEQSVLACFTTGRYWGKVERRTEKRQCGSKEDGKYQKLSHIYCIYVIIINHSHTHKHTALYATHMLKELADKEETDRLRWGWKCLAKRRWAWKRSRLLEHICFLLPELRPVLGAVRDWKRLHVHVADPESMQICLWSSNVCYYKCEHMCAHADT